MSTTTNYGWTKPTVGGDNNNWGTDLNADLDAIDSTVYAVSGVANAALPLAGGTLSGRLDLKTATADASTQTGVTGATNLDLSVANYFALTFSGSTTFTFTNVPAATASGGNVIVCAFRLSGAGGAITLTWPASVKWPGGVQPTWSGSGKTDMTVLCSDDNGTTWRCTGYSLNVS